MNLKDKIVVITGASGGLGKSLAISLKNEGVTVIISSHQKDELKKTADDLGVEYIVADVREEVQVQDLSQQVIDKFGRIDIWVNNAGVFYSFSKGDTVVDMEKANDMMQTNFFGTLYGCRTALRKMESGLIVNILSTAALDSTRAKDAKIYAASKWATRGYLQAIQAQNDHVKFLSVYPGGTKTDLYRHSKPDNYDDFMEPEYVIEKVVSNLKMDELEAELIIRRPNA